MTRRNKRERAVNQKRAELRQLREQQFEVDKSMWELKRRSGEVSKEIAKVRTEIRFLGGKARLGTEYDEVLMLGNLRDEGRLSDERL